MKTLVGKSVVSTLDISEALGCTYASAYHITAHFIACGLMERVGRVYGEGGGNKLLFALAPDFSSRIGEAFAGLLALSKGNRPQPSKVKTPLDKHKRIKRGKRGREFLAEPYRDLIMTMLAEGRPRVAMLHALKVQGFTGSIWTLNKYVSKLEAKHVTSKCGHCGRKGIGGQEPIHNVRCPANRAVV